MTRTNIDSSIRIAAALGAQLPKDFTRDIERLRGLEQQATKLNQPDIEEAFIAAFDSGKDPLEDKTVAAALNPPPNFNRLRPIITKHEKTLLERHLPGIIAAFQPVFEREAATIYEANNLLGPWPTLNPEDPHIPKDKADAVKKAHTANLNIAHITNHWQLLHQHLAGAGPMTAFTEPEPERWWRSGLARFTRPLTAWTAVQHGFTLSLAPSYYEAAKRNQQIEAEREHWQEVLYREHRGQTSR